MLIISVQQWEQRRQKNLKRQYNRAFKKDKDKVPLNQENTHVEETSEEKRYKMLYLRVF